MDDFSNFLLRWSVGIQDTIGLRESGGEKYHDTIWLTKLSIVSFQKWFPEAKFVLLFNGHDFEGFISVFNEMTPVLDTEIQIIDQRHPHCHVDLFRNPYHFSPRGVWWKWIPFRFDKSKHEIAIDTDIICVGRPLSWYNWLESEGVLMIAPERYETVMVNTCGDFYRHPLLRGKIPFNCGVVGQKAGYDYSERFFEITEKVRFGETHDSLFITEQGAINLWIRSLEVENVPHYVLPFEENAWMRDFIYFIDRGVQVETIHAVTWHKRIAKFLKDVLERRVADPGYSQATFLANVLKHGSDLHAISKHILRRQLVREDSLDREFLLDN